MGARSATLAAMQAQHEALLAGVMANGQGMTAHAHNWEDRQQTLRRNLVVSIIPAVASIIAIVFFGLALALSNSKKEISVLSDKFHRQ